MTSLRWETHGDEWKKARREHIAMQILVAMLTCGEHRGAVECAAIRMADDFIRKLDEPEGRKLE